MRARIYRQEKNPMQSGKAQCGLWRLAYDPESPKTVEPLMGWTSTKDTLPEVRMDFATREQAIAFAEAHGIAFDLFEPPLPARRPKAYGDNFRTERKIPWSH